MSTSLGMIMIIMGLVVGAPLLETKVPTVIAQQEQQEEWKTYYNPNLKFAIDYPITLGLHNLVTNITESKNTVEFDMEGFSVTVRVDGRQVIDPQELAVMSQQSFMDNKEKRDRILEQSVDTTVYDGVIGYYYIIFDQPENLYTVDVYFDDYNRDYNITFIGFRTFGFFDTVDQFLSSLRFFD